MKKRKQPTIGELRRAYYDAINAGHPRLHDAIWLSKVIAAREGVLLGGLTPEPPLESGGKPKRVRKLYRQEP